MTVSDKTSAAKLTGNGVTSFPFTLKCFSESDIKITHIDADGVDEAMVLNVDYEVTLNADQDATPGGSVSFPRSGSSFSTIVTGEILLAEYDVDLTQLAEINNTNFYPHDVEVASDRLTIIAKQLKRLIDRCVKLPSSLVGTVDTLLSKGSVVAGQALVFNDDGDGLTTAPLPGVTAVSRVLARHNSAQVITYNTSTPLQFDVEVYDSLSEFDVTTNKGRFTATADGYYHFSANCTTNDNVMSGGEKFHLSLVRSDGFTLNGKFDICESAITRPMSSSVSGDIYMTEGQYVTVNAYYNDVSGSISLLASTPGRCNVSIHRLY